MKIVTDSTEQVRRSLRLLYKDVVSLELNNYKCFAVLFDFLDHVI